jgi:hypothetical protein
MIGKAHLAPFQGTTTWTVATSVGESLSFDRSKMHLKVADDFAGFQTRRRRGPVELVPRTGTLAKGGLYGVGIDSNTVRNNVHTYRP